MDKYEKMLSKVFNYCWIMILFFLKKHIVHGWWCHELDYVHEQEEKSYVYFKLGKFRRNMQLGL
jgi:hypothetical protein